MEEFQLKHKVILLISPEPWGTNYVSKHHFAITLAESNQVYFLNPPSNSFRKTLLMSNLYLLDYKSSFRGLRKLPSFLSCYLIKIEIKRLEYFLNCTIDIIWNFDSSRFFNLRLLRNKLRIAHLVDYTENFQRPLLCKTSNLCLCTSNAIAFEIKPINQNVFNIGHGYQDGFIPLDKEDLTDFSETNGIRVGYVGNLDIKYIDWKAINTIVNENPTISFYFIGPVGKSNLSGSNPSPDHYFKQVRLKDNVYLPGPKPSSKLPAYLHKMDILLLSYKSEDFRRQLANPHKILEYLGSGNVIVASWTEEYKDRLQLLEMVAKNSDLPEKFAQIISNLSYYNSREKKEMRKAYALEHTYKKKVKTIENLINAYGFSAD